MSRRIDLTIGKLLDDMAGRYPDNEALVYHERGLRYSYREFNEVCRQVAKGLLKLGIRKGDNISIWAYNVPEWVILQFATAKIGAILVTVNTSYKSAELEYILNQSDSTALFHGQILQGHRLCGHPQRGRPGTGGKRGRAVWTARSCRS